MKKSKRLQPIASIAQSREKQMAIELGEGKRKLQSQQARLLELNNYLLEYQKRFTKNGAAGLNPDQLRNYQRFIENLRRAIEEQNTITTNAAEEVNDKRQQWFDRRNKVKVYEKVISRYYTDEEKSEQRKEQQDLDELSQRTQRKNSI